MKHRAVLLQNPFSSPFCMVSRLKHFHGNGKQYLDNATQDESCEFFQLPFPFYSLDRSSVSRPEPVPRNEPGRSGPDGRVLDDLGSQARAAIQTEFSQRQSQMHASCTSAVTRDRLLKKLFYS